MSTYGDIQTNIANKIARTDLTTQIQEEINNAITFYSDEHFSFNETTGTFVTVNAQKSYSSTDGVPTNIKEIDSLKIAISTGKYIYPREVPFQKSESDDRSSATGLPREWSYYNGKFYFYPIPNGAYTVTIAYLKNYTDLSNSSDTNDFTTTTLARKIIEAHATRALYEDYILDADQAAVQQKRELEYFMKLKEHAYRLAYSTKRIMAHGD